VSLILASKSAIRATLLRAAAVAFEAQGSGVDEDALKSGWLAAGRTPQEIAEGLAEAKALAVSRLRPDAWVIGADQTLEFEGVLFDKPADFPAARERLLAFRGKPHQLHCGTALARNGEIVWRTAPTSTLHVRAFSDDWLDAYLAGVGDDVLQSVGAYQLEGLGVQLFDRIDGDWFAILGLPMVALLNELRSRQVIAS
jgi:septum formation protein